jgi:tetratricopeptide (TPR) repeat protein
MGWLLLLALTATVAGDGVLLRLSCDHDAPVVAPLEPGEPLTLGFALLGEAGNCYRVTVNRAGQTLAGYLPTSAVRGAEQFDDERRAAPTLLAPAPSRAAANNTASPAPVARALELMNAARYEEALGLLETALQSGAPNPSLLALAGTAALRADRARDAITYWQQSLELAHNPVVARQLEQARREVAADESAERLVGARFQLRFDRRLVSAEQARALVDVLDAEWLRLAEQLGCRAEERWTAILQSRDAYLRTTGAAEWSGAQFTGRIHLALLEPVPAGATRRALAHELVHACLAQLGDWPAWLHEGLAQKLSGVRLTPAEQQQIAAAARSGRLPSLSALTQTFTRLGPNQAAVAYAAALAATDHLFQHYGASGVRSLLQNPQRLPQLTRELDRLLRQ